MKQPTCKTCRWWDRPWPNREVNKRSCAALEDRDGDDAVIDDDGTSRPLYTGPDFGCVHHEPKEGA